MGVVAVTAYCKKYMKGDELDLVQGWIGIGCAAGHLLLKAVATWYR